MMIRIACTILSAFATVLSAISLESREFGVFAMAFTCAVAFALGMMKVPREDE